MAYINVNILANPRVYYAMAEDGILPQIFKRVNSKTQVQDFAMSFFVGAIVLILIFVTNFGTVLDYIMFFDTIGLSLAALSIFKLRQKTRHLDGTGIYTIKWYPYIPAIFILTYWFVTANIFATFGENHYAAFICLGAYALGLIIYYACTYKKKPAPNTD